MTSVFVLKRTDDHVHVLLLKTVIVKPFIRIFHGFVETRKKYVLLLAMSSDGRPFKANIHYLFSDENFMAFL